MQLKSARKLSWSQSYEHFAGTMKYLAEWLSMESLQNIWNLKTSNFDQPPFA
jgi:hypothetical protein